MELEIGHTLAIITSGIKILQEGFMDYELSTYIKKLTYLSQYRGCKESEIIFSNFAQKYLTNLDEASLKDYEKILQIPDARLLDWFLFKKETPEDIKNNLVYDKIINSISASN
ncbi:MAG: succinate dehydrogenase assembly factor 2 [Rickettsiaceae bacterium]|nr:succinate dehydrogenase assembly factor 2 [Rickettsiaceae bacterium]